MHLADPPETFYRSTGCTHCGQSGFSKRRFLLDILCFDDQFIQVFDQSSDVAPLEKHLGMIGYQGADEEGLQLLIGGKVSPEEYIASVVL